MLAGDFNRRVTGGRPTFLLATTNKGKIIEMRESLADLDCALLAPEDLPHPLRFPPEHADTFAENALEKARFCFAHSGFSAIADDSGILVEALRKELGIHTRRWGAGPKANDAAWIAYFLERMRHEPEKNAEFVCVIAFVDGTTARTFEGRCMGVITDTLEADYLPGLPISACFRPDGCDKVFSALSLEEKNRVSHRGKAMAQLREFLEQRHNV